MKDRIAQSVITARIRRISVGRLRRFKTSWCSVFELRIDYGPETTPGSVRRACYGNYCIAWNFSRTF
jgi:hypothetical protein